MARPTDWNIVDLPHDPTPGEAWGVRQLSIEYGKIAIVAGEVATVVKAVKATSATGIWLGEAGDTFRTKLDNFPEDSEKCAKSYGIARDAMTLWATTLDETQTKADTNLNTARIAHADLEAAKATLATALASQSSASSRYDQLDDLYQKYQDTTPPPYVRVPQYWEVQQSRNASATAASAVSGANSSIQDAQSRLDTAKRMVAEAQASYNTAATTVVTKLQNAKDAGVRADNVWEAIYHSDAWKVIVAIVTVIVIVLAVVALFTPLGPLAAALLLAGGALLLADTTASFLEGETSPAEFGLAVVMTLIPGGKLLNVIRQAGKFVKGGSALSRIRQVSASVRRGEGLVQKLSAGEVRFSQSTVSFNKVGRDGKRFTYDEMVESMRSGGWKGDPIDVVKMRDGKLTSLDNTRVRAAREADIPVKAKVRGTDEPLTPFEIERFTRPDLAVPSTWSDAAEVRIGGQSGSFGTKFPYGSDLLPKVTGRPR